jgi:hypothetical protein
VYNFANGDIEDLQTKDTEIRKKRENYYEISYAFNYSCFTQINGFLVNTIINQVWLPPLGKNLYIVKLTTLVLIRQLCNQYPKNKDHKLKYYSDSVLKIKKEKKPTKVFSTFLKSFLIRVKEKVH